MNGVIIPCGGDVIYRDFTWNNVAITTRDGSTNIYYTSGDANKLDIFVDGYTPISATVKDWGGATAPVSLYIASVHYLGAFSSVSQGVASVSLRVAYIKN